MTTDYRPSTEADVEALIARSDEPAWLRERRRDGVAHVRGDGSAGSRRRGVAPHRRARDALRRRCGSRRRRPPAAADACARCDAMRSRGRSSSTMPTSCQCSSTTSCGATGVILMRPAHGGARARGSAEEVPVRRREAGRVEVRRAERRALERRLLPLRAEGRRDRAAGAALDGRLDGRARAVPAHGDRRGARSSKRDVHRRDDRRPTSDAAGFVSGAVEIFAGDGAQVDVLLDQPLGRAASTTSTRCARSSGATREFLGMAAGIGSKLTKMRIDDGDAEARARASKLLGVTFGDGDQHFDYNTLQNHVGTHTISDLQFKSALTDSASLVWYGITRINDDGRRQRGEPDVAQPAAQRAREGGADPDPRDRGVRRVEVQPRRHGGPGRRGRAVLPGVARHPARRGGADAGRRLLRRASSTASRTRGCASA